ncbi:hypothetical protein WN51_07965 [Melipona quadrifasciata]|uniref:Uncharacterized protein n=1 Tax=Melipona quadrifasciata TaxID=166423 RepID=A0A0N0BBZ9_9HYME|nr:hypothetical protein WN51_07965 [Melipona quadrifasciata]
MPWHSPIQGAFVRRGSWDVSLREKSVNKGLLGWRQEVIKLKQFWKEGIMRLPERWKKVMKNTWWFYSQLFYVSHVTEESGMSYLKRQNLENPLKSKNVSSFENLKLLLQVRVTLQECVVVTKTSKIVFINVDPETICRYEYHTRSSHQFLVVDVHSIKTRGVRRHSVYYTTKAAVEVFTLVSSLYVCYINDIPYTQNSTLRSTQTSPPSSPHRGITSATTYIPAHLDQLQDYFTNWKLKINPVKTQAIAFKNPNSQIKSPLQDTTFLCPSRVESALPCADYRDSEVSFMPCRP